MLVGAVTTIREGANGNCTIIAGCAIGDTSQNTRNGKDLQRRQQLHELCDVGEITDAH